MAPVIDNMVLSIAGYKFRKSFNGKYILQIGYITQNWDTNSGMPCGHEYTSWRDANQQDAEK